MTNFQLHTTLRLLSNYLEDAMQRHVDCLNGNALKDYALKYYGLKDYGLKDYGLKDCGLTVCSQHIFHLKCHF